MDLFGIATALKRSDYDSLNLEFCADERFKGMYALCTAFAAHRLRQSEYVKRKKPKHIEILVERGDVNQHKLFELLDENPFGFQMSTRRKKATDEHGTTVHMRQFELADLFAYEHRLFVERHLGESDRDIRKSAQALEERLNIEKGTWSLDAMRRICERQGIPRRFGSVPFRGSPGSAEY